VELYVPHRAYDFPNEETPFLPDTHLYVHAAHDKYSCHRNIRREHHDVSSHIYIYVKAAHAKHIFICPRLSRQI